MNMYTCGTQVCTYIERWIKSAVHMHFFPSKVERIASVESISITVIYVYLHLHICTFPSHTHVYLFSFSFFSLSTMECVASVMSIYPYVQYIYTRSRVCLEMYIYTYHLNIFFSPQRNVFLLFCRNREARYLRHGALI